jgi:hypothetical protein
MARFFVRRNSGDRWYTRRRSINVRAPRRAAAHQEETRQNVSIAAFFITLE